MDFNFMGFIFFFFWELYDSKILYNRQTKQCLVISPYDEIVTPDLKAGVRHATKVD